MKQRQRILNPDFFTDEELAKALTPLQRIFYAGLWTIADRRGRLADRPGEIKIYTVPYDRLDINKTLQKFHDGSGLLERYEVKGKRYIQINPEAWTKYQSIHPKEKESVIPPPENSAKFPGTPRNSPELREIPSSSSSSSSSTSTSTSTLTSTKEYPFDEIIADLNLVTKREGRQKFKTGDNTKSSIRARFGDGYNLEDFKHVHRVKCQEWVGTEYEKHLNPDTLYRKSKFPKYAAQKMGVKKEKPNVGHTSGKDYGPTGKTQF